MIKYVSVRLTLGLLILGACIAAHHAAGADGPYNDNANARADIKQALTRAAATHTSVIVVFGANWCPDCRELDLAMKHGACASLIARDFQVVKVSVGHMDKNLDLAGSYGVTVAKGIPDIVILSPDNKVLYATRDQELARALDMEDTGIYDFLKRVIASVKR